MANQNQQVERSFALAKEQYAEWGVDVEQALSRLAQTPISLHCWQGDDVGGFENMGLELGGGLAVTGNYPGKARTPDELRSDLEQVLALVPGKHRLNLHACYAETGGRRVDRNAMGPEHFQNWIAAIRSRQPQDLRAEIEEGHKSVTACHLARIACQLGRTVNFDPQKERFRGDAEADALLTRDYRKPYVMPEPV